MQFSRALRALPVVFWLGPSAPDASLAAQARYRITTDGAWFFQEAGGKRLARLARGAQVAGGDARGDWLAVTLEGWIFATSVGPTPRAGFDLAVTRTPEENLRSAPAGALVGKLPQGFLLTRVADGATDRWVHVTRTGWVQKGDVEPIAAVVSYRTAADSDTVVAAPPPGRSPGVAATPEPPGRAGDEGTPGRRPGVSRGDTSSGAPDPTRVESARRTVLYRAPEGAPTGTLAPAAPLRVLSRSGDWTRVEIDGWVRSGELRPDIPNGATYLLARGPLPERGFVYVVVPDAKRAQLDALTPLATVQVTARVRAGRTRFLGNPVLDLMSLETLP